MKDTPTTQALAAIEMAQEHYRRPVVMCSFGKDSLVLLHLITEQAGCDWPVLFHREAAGAAEKYRYANELIEEWDLRVYDYPPAGTSMTRGNGQLEVVNHYMQGEARCDLPAGIDPDSERRMAAGEPFLCAKDDLLQKPFGRMDFPWDAVMVGHRGDDRCPIHGDLTLHTDILQMPGGADWIYPLRTWTEADVWDYIRAHDLPYQTTRYDDLSGTFREIPDKRYNADYHCACTRCLDPDLGPVVRCPKLNSDITNISAAVRWVGMKYRHCGPQPTQPTANTSN